MVRNDCNSKLKSARRRPLRDVSNGVVKSKKLKLKNDKQHSNNQDPLDRLLLVHSDISSLLRQIDELVVEAVNVDTNDNEKITEIKSFTAVLSEIHSSLKPWVPRLQTTLTVPPTESKIQSCETFAGASPETRAVDTPEPIKHESLVSPSPLVSWRATDCAEERGKQLFRLTPMVRARTTTSKAHAPPKLTACEGMTSNPITILPSPCVNDKTIGEKVEVVSENPVRTVSENPVRTSGFESAQKVPVDEIPTTFVTPCLKNPLKTYVLHEPDNDLTHRKITISHISTLGNGNLCGSTDSESSSGKVSEKLGLKYPELIGIKPSYTLKNESRALEASPAWIMSPPKCCKLLEPLDEKHPKDDASFQELASNFNQQLCLAPPKESNTNNNNQDKENKKFPLQGNLRGNFAVVESTPIWKGSASTIHRSKRPGENTLKRELWTRFEAASTNECQVNFSVFKDNSHKGFLERLEEASCDVGPDALR